MDFGESGRVGLGAGQPNEERKKVALIPADWWGWDAPARPGSAGILRCRCQESSLVAAP